jgi:hypothetical protein
VIVSGSAIMSPGNVDSTEASFAQNPVARRNYLAPNHLLPQRAEASSFIKIDAWKGQALSYRNPMEN